MEWIRTEACKTENRPTCCLVYTPGSNFFSPSFKENGHENEITIDTGGKNGGDNRKREEGVWLARRLSISLFNDNHNQIFRERKRQRRNGDVQSTLDSLATNGTPTPRLVWKHTRERCGTPRHLQLSISNLQCWESIGNSFKSIGHVAVTVNLQRVVSHSVKESWDQKSVLRTFQWKVHFNSAEAFSLCFKTHFPDVQF